MAEITYNDHTIDTGSTNRRVARRALCTAEREGPDAAAAESGLPLPLIRKWCDEVEVDLSQVNVASTPDSGNIAFFDPEQVAAARHGGATMTIYKGGSHFRFSAAAVALLGLEDGDELVFARDTADEREHVLLGKAEDGNAVYREKNGGSGFSSSALAKALGVYRPDEKRRFVVGSRPVEKSGLVLHKALLQEPTEKLKEAG